MQRLRVLVVEDDTRLAAVIAEQLHEEDFDVRLARSIAEAERMLPGLRPHCVLLDVGLPDGSGFDLCRRLRRAGGSWDPSLAIIMLTARVEEADVLRGFERGADDYVRKPFSMPELVSRVRVALVRRRPAGGGDLQVERLHGRSRIADGDYADQVLELAGKEFALLVELASDPGVLCSKQDLLNASGTTAAAAVRARSTRTRAGCDASCRPRARLAIPSRTCGAPAIGSSCRMRERLRVPLESRVSTRSSGCSRRCSSRSEA